MMFDENNVDVKLSEFQSGHPYYTANNGNNDRINNHRNVGI